MKTIATVDKLRAALKPNRQRSTVGLVPTMGNLHAGHTKLVQQARSECDVVVVTIFVNPLQFGESDDFVRYPRVFESDAKILRKEGTDLVFVPSVKVMYPQKKPTQLTRVKVAKLSDTLCGQSRKGHFQGVATVVCKLLNIVQPDRAYFGEKDWQQLLVIRTMVQDLNIPVEILAIPTVRGENGLALSSRNQYLSSCELEKASMLYSAMRKLRDGVLNSETDYTRLEEYAKQSLVEGGFEPEYVAVRDQETLQPPINAANRRIFAAAHLGSARLIDNLVIDD